MTVENFSELSADGQHWRKRFAVCRSLLPDPLAVICASIHLEEDARDFFAALFPHPVGDGDSDCLRCGEGPQPLQLGICETCWNTIQAEFFTRHAGEVWEIPQIGPDGEVWP